MFKHIIKAIIKRIGIGEFILFCYFSYFIILIIDDFVYKKGGGQVVPKQLTQQGINNPQIFVVEEVLLKAC